MDTTREMGPFVTGLVLFWPAVITIVLLGFFCLMVAVVFVGGTVIVTAIFFYGMYCILRDLGLLDTFFQRVGTITNLLSDHVKQNVETSFVFECEGTPLETPALYICHPHGLYGLTWFIHFASALSKWPVANRPVLAVHSIFFQLPLFRELFRLHRCIEATESELEACLKQGNSVALLVGGIEELHLTSAGPMQLILKKRKGFLRVSQRCNVPLVPLVSPAENTLFPVVEHPIWNWVERQLYERLRIAVPLPSWANILSWIRLAYKPFSTKLVTYMLKPVLPDGKSIEDIQSEYIKRLTEFSAQKGIALELKG